MSVRRYVPREFALVPEDFGKSSLIQWREKPEGARDNWDWYLAGSEVQHRAALMTGEWRTKANQPMTSRRIGELIGVNYDRVTRLLNGFVVMRLEDLAMIERMHRHFREALRAGDPARRLAATCLM